MIKHVHGIELSNRCNLACEYCPHSKIHEHRAIWDMREEVFLQAVKFLEWVECRHGSKKLIVAMFGESILHPDFCSMLRRLFRFTGHSLQVETNGIGMTNQIAKTIQFVGAKVVISNHDLVAARRAAAIVDSYGINLEVVAAFADPATKHTWAGQAGDDNVEYHSDCDFIPESRAVIMVDGTVTTCCLDAFGAGKLGTIWDDPDTMTPRRFSLCENCHCG